MEFLTGTLFGAPKWLWALLGVVLAVVLVIVAYTTLVDKQGDIARENREVGGAVQREKDLQETFNRVEKANEVRSGVEAEAAAQCGERLYAQCLRSARTPANCERFVCRGQED